MTQNNASMTKDITGLMYINAAILCAGMMPLE
jgi:hypothetical protein